MITNVKEQRDNYFPCCRDNGGYDNCPNKQVKKELLKSLDLIRDFESFCIKNGFNIEGPLDINLNKLENRFKHDFRMVVTLTNEFDEESNEKQS